METLADVGEFGLIRRIRTLLEERGGRDAGLIVGAGDDAAAMTPRSGYDLLVTCDAMVEGRHFLRDIMSPVQIGRRAMTMNISDIGAMGGFPRWALVSMGLELGAAAEDVLDLYRGFLEELNPLGAVIAGGNITRSGDGAFIDITLIGEVERGRMVRRSGAREGDAILVSGWPGQAAAGLDLLAHARGDGEAPEAFPLLQAYRTPAHRVREGRAIAGTGLANAMIDISDGLLGDLGHICEESRAGAEVQEDALPVSESLRWAARGSGEDPSSLVTRDSDDYELIVTCAPMHVDALRAAVARVSEVPVTRIGWITDAAGRLDLVRADGTRSTFERRGWDHFSDPRARG
ncbi:MAG: thiamine-phosphate kinase [Deltaproteobacteria bacterium]|nr:thiamine-phosphate kinase [Deltaproteobacteria bacterium]